MNKIESLPKVIVYKGNPYSIYMHCTAWNRLCLCYKKMFPQKNADSDIYILLEVVEPKMKTAPEFSKDISDVVDTPSFDLAVDMLARRLHDAFLYNIIHEYSV